MNKKLQDITRKTIFKDYVNLEKTINKCIKGRTPHHRVRVIKMLADEFEHELRALNYLEIGVHNGTSMAWSLLSKSRVNCLGIDLFDNIKLGVRKKVFPRYVKDKLNLNRTRKSLEALMSLGLGHKESAFKLFKGHSRDPNVIKFAGEYFQDDGVDILFIDGDHAEHAVKEDFIAYEGYVKKGGFIIFNDYDKKKVDGCCESSRFSL